MTNKFNDPNFDIQPQAEVTISSPQPRAEVTISSPQPQAEVTKFAPQPRAALTTQELQALVAAAQAGEQVAMDKLCEQFRPLVEATAKSYSLHATLGEDSLNIVWVIFLEFIKDYKEPISSTFPGLVKKHLHLRLINEVLQKGNYDPNVDYDDLESADDLATSCFDSQLVHNDELLQAILQLKPKERELLYLYYMEELPLQEIAIRQKEKLSTITVRNFRLLKKLRKQLLKSN